MIVTVQRVDQNGYPPCILQWELPQSDATSNSPLQIAPRAAIYTLFPFCPIDSVPLPFNFNLARSCSPLRLAHAQWFPPRKHCLFQLQHTEYAGLFSMTILREAGNSYLIRFGGRLPDPASFRATRSLRRPHSQVYNRCKCRCHFFHNIYITHSTPGYNSMAL